jgi:hypothetical protein
VNVRRLITDPELAETKAKMSSKEVVWKRAYQLMAEAQGSKGLAKLQTSVALVEYLQQHINLPRLTVDVWNEGLPQLLHEAITTMATVHPKESMPSIPSGQSHLCYIYEVRLALATALMGIARHLERGTKHLSMVFRVSFPS